MFNEVSYERPSFYAIIPASVRYDNTLSEFQKLLFAEITALADKHWYCRAWNSYFARLYNKDKKRVSKCITGLQKSKYITCQIDKEQGNIRKIFICELVGLPVHEKKDTAVKKVDRGIVQKKNSPIHEKHNHNNTRLNTTSDSSKNASTATFKKAGDVKDTTYLSIRNEVLGKDEVMNSAIKQELNTIREVSLEKFTKLVCSFKQVVDTILQKSLQQYLYYPVHNYDFVQFVKKINWFNDSFSTHAIINKLAKKEEIKGLNRSLAQQEVQKNTETAVVKLVDREVARRGRKKVADLLKK